MHIDSACSVSTVYLPAEELLPVHESRCVILYHIEIVCVGPQDPLPIWMDHPARYTPFLEFGWQSLIHPGLMKVFRYRSQVGG